MTEVIRLIAVRGRVQGVGYRAWVEETADQLGLAGWVRNRRDGSVEALFAGPADVVADMIVRCQRGPLSATVEALTETDGTADMLDLAPPDEPFAVLPTL
jgi:acylphosphatase